MKKIVSETDVEILKRIRENIISLLKDLKVDWDKPNIRILEIAPQVHEGIKATFENAEVETLDISPEYKPTYVADLCNTNNEIIPDNYFDLVVVTEVLEHTLQPFDAVKEIHRILKPGGTIVGSTPFDFRIHGPLPDCWRFTEHGLRALFKNYQEVEIIALENSERFLMPFHYTFRFKK
jgi:SAM-dependent methyltransferase